VVVDTIEESVNRFLQSALEEGKLDASLFDQLTHLQRFLTTGASSDDEK
jgi:hypothetical protein